MSRNRVSSGQLVLAGRADDLGNLRVRVHAVERVFAPGQRREDRLVVERLGEPQVVGVAGHGVEVGEHLVHAAVLVVQRRPASAPA